MNDADKFLANHTTSTTTFTTQSNQRSKYDSSTATTGDVLPDALESQVLPSSQTLLSDPAAVSQNNESGRFSASKSSVLDRRWDLWWKQVFFLVAKNFTLRCKSPGATILEILTPSLFMLILVLSHSLSTIYYVDEQVYASSNITFSGDWLKSWYQSQLQPQMPQQPMLDASFTNTSTPPRRTADNTRRGHSLEPETLDHISSRNPSYTSNKLQHLPQRRRQKAQSTAMTLHELKIWVTQNILANVNKQIHRRGRVVRMNLDKSIILTDVKRERDYIHASAPHDVRNPNMILRQRNTQQTNITSTDTSSNNEILNEGYQMLDKAYLKISQILQSPTEIPTFGEFIALSQQIQSFVNVSELPNFVQETSYGQDWGNILTLGTLHLSPTPIFDELNSTANKSQAILFWEYLNATYPEIMIGPTTSNTTNTTQTENRKSLLGPSITVQLHESEQKALEYINKNSAIERTWALLDFTNWPVLPLQSSSVQDNANNSYKIRMNYTTLPNTALILEFAAIGLNTAYQDYYLSGFLTLQRTINEYAFHQYSTRSPTTTTTTTNSSSCAALLFGSNRTNTLNIYSMPMPTASYSQNTFYLVVGFLLGFIIVMGYLYPFARLIKNIVEEKETKMKDILLIAGVSESAHWWSWLIFSILLFSIISVLVSITLSVNVFHKSQKLYLFVWMCSFSASSVGLCFTVSALFSKSKLASVIGPIALFATVLPRYLFFGFNRYEAVTAKKFASILPATALAFGADIIADYEYAGTGLQSWNVNDGAYSFRTSLNFLLIDTVLYLFLSCYLEQVIPRPFGSTRPFHFFLLPSYWFPASVQRHKIDETTRHNSNNIHNHNVDVIDKEIDTSKHEVFQGHDRDYDHDNDHVVESSHKPWLEVLNVSKQYDKKRPPAVNQLSFTFYKDQITALLGHNGAGKTSLLGMVTGLIVPTRGDCFIGGISIRHNPCRARQAIGFCPQENVLFDRLTVYEHIRLFLRLKGLQVSYDVIRSLAIEVGLHNFLHVQSQALSGGNKRKLCLAIAFAGDNKQTLLVLDEPTSGMDPSSRRACWECLRRKRLGRVIILVSHTLSEADLLADRVAIMKDGTIQASGSPLFLKDRFGLGYNLTVVVENNQNLGLVHNTGRYDSNKLLYFLQEYIPNTKLTRMYGKELTFRLPKGCEMSLSEAFDALKNKRKELNVDTFGIENASLEEVFLLLADENELVLEDDNTDPNKTRIVQSDIDKDDDHAIPLVPLSWLGQIYLMYWKRYTIQKRDSSGFFYSVLVPVLVVALVLLILTIDIPLVGPAIDISPSTLLTVVSNKEGSGKKKSSEFLMGGGSSSHKSQLHAYTLFKEMEAYQQQLYPVLSSIFLENKTSSADLSRYLLDTYNDNNHSSRYGAYVFDDTINSTFQVEWQNMQTEVSFVLNSSFTSNWLSTQTPDSLVELLASLPSDNANQSSTNDETLNFLASQLASGVIPLTSLRPFLPTESKRYDKYIRTNVSILHNASSPHGIAFFNQAYMNFIFQSCTKTKLVTPINHPLPLTTKQALEVKAVLSILTSMFLMMPFCFIPGTFSILIVKERSCKSKHLQFVSGCSVSAYWIGNYLWDLTMYCLTGVLIIFVFIMYGRDAAEAFVGSWSALLCTLLLILGYGISIIPFAYALARSFCNHSSAQIAVIVVCCTTGFGAVNAYFIMTSIEKTKPYADALLPLFSLWPAFNFGNGLLRLSTSFLAREVNGEDSQPFDWIVGGKPLVLLYALSLLYFLLLLFLEDGITGCFVNNLRRSIVTGWHSMLLKWHNVRYFDDRMVINRDNVRLRYSPDQDVIQERTLIFENGDDMVRSAPVVFKNLWKVYFPPSSRIFGATLAFPCQVLLSICRRTRCTNTTAEVVLDTAKFLRPKCAVNGLTVSVQRGETFVLLGPNGCGKTTSIGILSGDIAPTFGHVYVAGNDVTGTDLSGVLEARKHIGLCPQVDPLLENMTGRETLTFFGKVRGIPNAILDAEVTRLLDQLTLTPHADKLSQTYSGGNKRKLSLGISLIGRPDVLLIDESSSGVDPVAQRQIWNLIAKVSVGRSVLLTTHSMDEAQALSTKTGIMAAGQLLCLGSVQHLKSLYLGGYTIDVYLHESTDNSSIEDVTSELIRSVIPGALLTEQQGRFLRFNIPGTVIEPGSVGTMLARLEGLKHHEGKCLVENYSIKQCSLEQVFVKLVDTEEKID